MKKSITFYVLLLCLSHVVSAQILTVDNNANSAAMYTDLQAAVDAANAGDTIYVSGSDFSYGSIIIDKKIILFGSGYNPNNQFNQTPFLLTLKIERNFDGTIDPGGTYVSGFRIGNSTSSNVLTIWGWTGANIIENITVKRNQIVGSVSVRSSNNTLITGNYIKGAFKNPVFNQGGVNSNLIFSNNVINNRIENFRNPTIIISNNVFIGEGNPGNMTMFSGCVKTIVTNNILYYAGAVWEISPNGSCDLCTFNNNLSFEADIDRNEFIVGTNTGANNFIDVDPEFVFEDDGKMDFTDNYALKSSSLVKDAGTDGTDLGIYGGVFPWPAGDLSPSPPIPQIIEMNIQNAAIPTDGTINVDFKAKSSN